MKSKFSLALLIFPLFFINCQSGKSGIARAEYGDGSAVVALTNETFKTMVFNYDKNKEWRYEGEMPAIVDFYAGWCAPCRQLSPLIDEIAKEYSGKIVVYKVDTEAERLLAQNMGITGLPTILFIPAKGQPQLSMGYLPKESLTKAVNEILLVN